jgi:adenosylhomocysteine nucleosidase
MSDILPWPESLFALTNHSHEAVIVSADAEWRQVKKLFPQADYQASPYGEFFFIGEMPVVQGGWGKISAAASVQYVIGRWNADSLINLGTCGGVDGRIERRRIVLASKTIVYDIAEQIGDARHAVDFYTTDIDLRWVGDRLPEGVVVAPLCSADRDLVPVDLGALVTKYDAIAADWESGSIAWVSARNRKRVLILRSVSDLVYPDGGEAYGTPEIFEREAGQGMRTLFHTLPQWLQLLRSR